MNKRLFTVLGICFLVTLVSTLLSLAVVFSSSTARSVTSRLILSPAPAAAAQAKTGKPIKIGYLGTFTGHSASSNPWMLNGAQLAINEYGSKLAGRQIELISEDSASSPTVSVDKARKLVEQDQVDALMGPLPANCAMPVAAYLAKTQIPHIAVEELPINTAGLGKWSFTHAGTQRGIGYYAGLYAYDTLGYRRATVIHDDIVFAEDFLQGAMDGFVSRGGKIVQRQRAAMNTMDYGPYITKMQNADVVFYWFVGQNTFKFINQYPQYSLKMPLLEAGVRALQTPQLQQLGDKALGMCMVAPYDISLNFPEVQNWVNRWNQLFSSKSETDGKDADNYAGQCAYISVHALLEAIKTTNGDTTPAVFNKALKNLQCNTPWGKLGFNDQGIGIGSMYILKVVKSGDRYVVNNAYTYPQAIRDEPANVKDMAPKM